MSRAIRPIRLFAAILYLVLASAGAEARQSVLHEYHGDAYGSELGTALGRVGDVDGDGTEDVVFGAPWDDTVETDAGLIRIVSGYDGSVFRTVLGENDADKFGWSVGGGGDYDGDGFCDIIVGVPRYDFHGPQSGAVVVLSGLDNAVLYTFHGDYRDSHMGWSVSDAGDVNADGRSDLIAGAYYDSTYKTRAGNARVFSGLNGQVLYSFYGASYGDELGTAVSGAGDVDNDGYDDVMAGAPHESSYAVASGMAYAYSGQTGAVLFSVHGDTTRDKCGCSVSAIGDLNGDNFADVLIGVPGEAFEKGAVQALLGPLGTLHYQVTGTLNGAQLGYSLAGGGDSDQDGVNDFMAGSPEASITGTWSGASTLFSGATGAHRFTVHGEVAFESMGLAVSGGGDFNSDGLAEVLVSRPHANTVNGVDSGTVQVLSPRACGGKAGFGTACNGAAGYAPELSYIGCAVQGENALIRVERGEGGAPLALVLSTSTASVPLPNGCVIDVSLAGALIVPGVFPGFGGGVGSVTYSGAVNSTGTVYIQALVKDSVGGLITSNGIRVDIIP